MPNFQFDFDQYEKLLKAIAAMSSLYSDNQRPFVHSRFVEKLYVYTSKAKDLSRSVMSFDAILDGNIGVGIKTFTVNNFNVEKSEKIAEMTRHATSGLFKNLSLEELAKKSAQLRNLRMVSDINEYGIDIKKSIYHCLVRAPGKAMVHEEPYSFIDISSIKPLDDRGIEITNFPNQTTGNSHFTDGKNKYTYNVAKNVLFKKFDLNSFNNSTPIDIAIYKDIFSKALSWFSQDINELTSEENKQEDFIVLPLYGKNNEKIVFPKSGLNQWNAGGRLRKFGEAYIPVPMEAHRKKPNFFPPRDIKFDLLLPNKTKVVAKICQDNNKALMSDPNYDLCEWLFKLIDGSLKISKQRLSQEKPYIYDDLRAIGKDSVKIIKKSNSSYELYTLPLDSYEIFLDENFENGRD